MHDWSAWTRLVRSLEENEPFLPALRSYLLSLRSLIAEAREMAPRHLRRRRALRWRRPAASRVARRVRRSSAA